MARPLVQLAILLLAIPAQYFITLWGTTSPDSTSIKVRKLVTTLQEFFRKWIFPKTWLEELKKLWFYLTDDQGECVAVEVMKHRSDVGYFANSPEPRHTRPAQVKYRVGQVFLHKSLGYHGVIIGWDHHARAPESWLEEQYGNKFMEKLDEPHYAVLPDAYENHELQTYVTQDDIEIVSNRKIENDAVHDYFESFDGTAYKARPFLKQLYPQD